MVDLQHIPCTPLIFLTRLIKLTLKILILEKNHCNKICKDLYKDLQNM